MEKFHLHLIPFMSALRAGVNCMMTSHAVYPAVDPEWPATLSHEICLLWLRQRLGFGGVLFTDDLDMAAIAGNFSPQEVALRGLSCSADFFLSCQKSESIGPMYAALADQIENDQSVQRFHSDTIRRFELLRGGSTPRSFPASIFFTLQFLTETKPGPTLSCKEYSASGL